MVAYLNVFEKLANSNTFFKKNEQDELEFQHSSLQLKLQNSKRIATGSYKGIKI